MTRMNFNPLLRKLTLMLAVLSTFFCHSKRKEDNELIIGLVVGQVSGRTSALSFVTDYNGNWDTGFTYDASGQLTGTPNGRWILATNPDGSGSIITFFGSGSDVTYRFLSFNAATRQLFYQNTPGTNNFSPRTYGRFDFTAITNSGCERSASKCFYYCETVFGQTTLAAAQASTATSNTAAPTSATACGGSTFSRALYRTDNATWSFQ